VCVKASTNHAWKAKLVGVDPVWVGGNLHMVHYLTSLFPTSF
jgi:hypothetical protein